MRRSLAPDPRARAPHLRWAGAALGALVLWSAGCGGGGDPIVVSPPRFDFGRVMAGDTREQAFTVTNQGDRTTGLTIQSSCGCLAVAQTDMRPLDPGQSVVFRVRFDARKVPLQKMRGKYVAIHTDRPDGFKAVVPFEAEVYRAYVLDPPVMEVGHIDGGAEDFEPQTVTIRPEGSRSIRFVGFTATPDVYDVEATPLDGKGLSLSIRLRHGLTRPVGGFLAQVRLDLEVTVAPGEVLPVHDFVLLRGFWDRGE